MRQLIYNIGIVVLLLCAIAIGMLCAFVDQEVKQLAYLADDQPPSHSRRSISVRKKRSAAHTMSYYIRGVGYLACGIGITTLAYCSVCERRRAKSPTKPFTIS